MKKHDPGLLIDLREKFKGIAQIQSHMWTEYLMDNYRQRQ